MKFKLALILAIWLGVLSANSQTHKEVRIVPRPHQLSVGQGTFLLIEKTDLQFPKANKDMERIAGYLREYIKDASGIELSGKSKKNAFISLKLDNKLDPEAYMLVIEPDRIVIEGGSEAGVFYGVQTLRQMLNQYPVEQSTTGPSQLLPIVAIYDKPVFGYRGGHLDVVRHFFGKEEVMTYIDILAMHKMNTFHWHLTDDQGWRIQIDQYPKLTEEGAIRHQTLVGRYDAVAREWDNTPYGGYYTKDDIREVVQYASDRFITIIPEVEMPGHAKAALTAYPHLGCTQEGYYVEGLWGVFDDVFCAGRETTFEFLEGVLTEVIELFPSQYIHIGGDECPKVRWKACADCQNRMREEGLATEEELQSYFVHRMEKWLNEHGRNIIGWDEIMEGGLSPTATVMAWRSWTKNREAIEASKAGNKVIMVPNSHCYLDYNQGKDTDKEPIAFPSSYTPIEKTYTLDPYEGIEEQYRHNIIGVQGNLWTEYVLDFPHAQYMLLPRLASIAETGWSYGEKDYDDFVDRMKYLVKIYEQQGYRYAPHIFNR